MKRVLVHAAAFNIGLLLRKLSGWGKPRQPQGRLQPSHVFLFILFVVQEVYAAVSGGLERLRAPMLPGLSSTTCSRVALR
ncbi:MAG: hypothetical protein ABJC63_11095 [Gemmatimonadales bacterium]